MKTKNKPIGVKVTRSELRNRKIIIVIEPDLLSNETFAVNPFYDEGEKKNRLQNVDFIINVSEKLGAVEAAVSYGGTHYTTGHRQIHGISSYYTDKKDCALNWAMTENEEYLSDGRLKQVLGMWGDDIQFKENISLLFNERKNFFKKENFKKIKENYKNALKELEEALKLIEI